jgi:hypothetical protein
MTDAVLGYGPCSVCGVVQNDPEWVSRMPCEQCGRVICYECADTGVYGSAPDFSHFVSGPFNRKPYYLSPDSCPYCKKMDWMKKHGG